MKRRGSKGIALMLVLVLALSLAVPDTAWAAKKRKPVAKIKTVELRMGGKKVNSKTVTIKQGSKTKLKVVVKPGNAKKSVKWGKLSKKAKKIATISKSGVISAKKRNGTIKVKVTVRGKNKRSSKTVWVKIKVAKKKNLPKPAVKPGNSGTAGKTYTVRFNRSVGHQKVTFKEGTVVDLSNGAYAYTVPGSDCKHIGWSLTPNGSIISSIKVTGDISLYSVWVQKDINRDWNPTFVQGDGSTLDTSLPVYDNDGVKTYNEMVSSYITDATIVCDCGKACQFKVKDHKGRVIVVDKFLYDAPTGKCYLLTGNVQATRTLSSDWAYLDITSAYDAVTTSKCTCDNIWNFRSERFDGSHSAMFKR